MIADARYDKKAVEYTDDHGDSPEQCSKCHYYINQETCRIVRGRINPEGWCNRFKRRRNYE